MPEKYVRQDALPILVRHTGRTTLPQDPPALGDGRPVVCLHDAGLQSSVFVDLLGAAAPDGGAIAFDLPGHGRSGSLDSLPSIEAMTGLARRISDWCGAARPVLLGHGMGALLALEWARSQPDAVGGLVLCGAGLALGIPDEAIETMRQVTRGKAPRPFDPKRVCPDGGREMMQRAYMEGIQTDPRATLVDLEASRAWADAFDPKGSGIACPITIVSGAAEDAGCIARAEALASSLASARTATIEGAAHFLPLEQPAALARELRQIAEAA
jgi:pimeloyl-ACP methyl ester carboxylesterase